MSQENNNNGFLYFAVGALLVAVLGMGYFFTQQDKGGDLTVIETSSGEKENPDFNLEVDEDGFKGSADNDQ